MKIPPVRCVSVAGARSRYVGLPHAAAAIDYRGQILSQRPARDRTGLSAAYLDRLGRTCMIWPIYLLVIEAGQFEIRRDGR